MRRKKFKRISLPAWFLFLLGLQLSAAVLNSSAADNPHNGNNDVQCISCHDASGVAAKGQEWWSDQEANVCGTCHNTANPREGTDVVTHRNKTDNSILVQCTQCHDPHRQQQMRTWKTLGYLYSGISDTIGGIDPTAKILTCSTATWGTNQWQNMVLVPNVNSPAYNYRIASNTQTTITIDTGGTSENGMFYARGGQTFAIVLGKLVKQTVNLRSVKFFRETGTNSFADGDSTADGICQVCHTQTKYFRNNGTVLDQGHPAAAGEKCVTCHNHQIGFKATCTTCHGNPPIDITAGGPTGLAKNNSTGLTTKSATAGAHTKHATSAAKGYACDVCHYNSAGSGTEHNNGLVITLGFKSVGPTLLGGSYNGQSVATYNTSTITTSVTNTGSAGGGDLRCSNIYCHSTVQSGADGKGAPIYAAPVWDDLGSVVCGSCHKAAMDTGSHTKHLSVPGATCDTCHTSSTSSTHVDGSINMQPALAYQGSPDPRAGYSTCSTAYCHDNGTGTAVTTPTWGTEAAACTACHALQPPTGSHTRHLTQLSTGFNRNAVCGDCHSGAVQGTTPPAQHLDGDIDVYKTTAGDLGYTADKPKGTAYANCSTAYCHSNGMDPTALNAFKPATWGNASTGCNFCHNALPTSGAHAKHVKTAATSYGSTSVNTINGNNDFGCGNCHPVNSVNHVNGTLDITLNKNHGGTLKQKNNVSDDTSGYTRTTGSNVTCSASYCHSKGNGTFDVTSPNWYGTYTGDTCGHCHGNSPATGSHQSHVMAGVHYDTIYTGTASLKPAATRSDITGQSAAVRPHGNAATATTINCNICHNGTVTVSYNRRNSQCVTCHDPGQPVNATIGDADMIITGSSHLNGAVDVVLPNATVNSKAQIRTEPTGWTRNTGYKVSGAYDSATINNTDWNGSGQKTCTTACHLGQASPAWGTQTTCDSCHVTLPQ